MRVHDGQWSKCLIEFGGLVGASQSISCFHGSRQGSTVLAGWDVRFCQWYLLYKLFSWMCLWRTGCLDSKLIAIYRGYTVIMQEHQCLWYCSMCLVMLPPVPPASAVELYDGRVLDPVIMSYQEAVSQFVCGCLWGALVILSVWWLSSWQHGWVRIKDSSKEFVELLSIGPDHVCAAFCCQKKKQPKINKIECTVFLGFCAESSLPPEHESHLWLI